MTASIAFATTPLLGYDGYYGYWRFSELRSAEPATSDRSAIGGQTMTRCITAIRSR